MVSYNLRLASPIAPRERLTEVWRQLSGIGGGRSLGFGPNRVRSLPDGEAQALAEYLENTRPDSTKEEEGEDKSRIDDNGHHMMSELAHSSSSIEEMSEEGSQMRFGDLCLECGQAVVEPEVGYRKCYACRYSECQKTRWNTTKDIVYSGP